MGKKRPLTGSTAHSHTIASLGQFVKQIPRQIIYDKEQLYIQATRLREENTVLKQQNTKLKTKVAILQHNFADGNQSRVGDSTARQIMRRQLIHSKNELRLAKEENSKLRHTVRFTKLQELQIMIKAQKEELARVTELLHSTHQQQSRYLASEQSLEYLQRELNKTLRQNQSYKKDIADLQQAISHQKRQAERSQASSSWRDTRMKKQLVSLQRRVREKELEVISFRESFKVMAKKAIRHQHRGTNSSLQNKNKQLMKDLEHVTKCEKQAIKVQQQKIQEQITAQLKDLGVLLSYRLLNYKFTKQDMLKQLQSVLGPTVDNHHISILLSQHPFHLKDPTALLLHLFRKSPHIQQQELLDRLDRILVDLPETYLREEELYHSASQKITFSSWSINSKLVEEGGNGTVRLQVLERVLEEAGLDKLQRAVVIAELAVNSYSTRRMVWKPILEQFTQQFD